MIPILPRTSFWQFHSFSSNSLRVWPLLPVPAAFQRLAAPLPLCPAPGHHTEPIRRCCLCCQRLQLKTGQTPGDVQLASLRTAVIIRFLRFFSGGGDVWLRNSCLQPPRGEMRFGDSPLWFATCCRDGKGAPIPGFSQEMGAGRGHRGESTSPRAHPELPQSSPRARVSPCRPP